MVVKQSVLMDWAARLSNGSIPLNPEVTRILAKEIFNEATKRDPNRLQTYLDGNK